jgi:hypothetical protein
LVFLWLFRPERVQSAFDGFVVPMLGLVFLPFATFAYILIAPEGVQGLDWLWLGLAFPADMGVWAGAGILADGGQRAPIGATTGRGAPDTPESNWLRTVPGKGWFTLFRPYSSSEPFFDQSWRPGDFEKILCTRGEHS